MFSEDCISFDFTSLHKLEPYSGVVEFLSAGGIITIYEAIPVGQTSDYDFAPSIKKAFAVNTNKSQMSFEREVKEVEQEFISYVFNDLIYDTSFYEIVGTIYDKGTLKHFVFEEWSFTFVSKRSESFNYAEKMSWIFLPKLVASFFFKSDGHPYTYIAKDGTEEEMTLAKWQEILKKIIPAMKVNLFSLDFPKYGLSKEQFNRLKGIQREGNELFGRYMFEIYD